MLGGNEGAAAVAIDCPALENPVGLRVGQGRAFGSRWPMLSSPSSSISRPAVEAKPCARRSAPVPTTIGRCAQPMSPNGSTITVAKGARRRASAAALSSAATRTTSRPRRPHLRPPQKRRPPPALGQDRPPQGRIARNPIHTARAGPIRPRGRHSGYCHCRAPISLPPSRQTGCIPPASWMGCAN